MILQIAAPILPISIFVLISLLVLVVILLQCAKTKKASIESGEGVFRKNSSYEDNSKQTEIHKENPEVLANEEEDVCAENKPRSSTTNSGGSLSIEISTRPKQLTPLPTRSGSQICQDIKEEEETVTNLQNEPQKNGEVVTEKKIVGESKQEQKTTPVEGSYETSGDSLYAKVKSVPEQEEFAYSVVELSSKDNEYEMVEGKLKRLEMKARSQSHKVETNEYEAVAQTPKRRLSLDPVLFAIEDSGASGIYEDVPDSSKVVKRQTPVKKEEVQSDQKDAEKPPEQKTKKWGLTRFSIKGKNKKKAEIGDDVPDCPPQVRGSPKEGDEKSYLTEASDSVDHKGTKPSYKRTGSLNPDNTPPPPPIENLRLKADHRRTIHMTDSIPPHPPSPTPPPPRSILAGSKFPVATPNTYTTVTTGQEDLETDQLYEEPDREVIPSTRRTVTKRREDAKAPAVPPYDPVEKQIDYETISCDIDLTSDEISSESDTKATGNVNEPKYAIVNRKSTKKIKPKSVEISREIIEPPKLQVFIKKTRISTQVSNDGSLNETENKSRVIEKTELHENVLDVKNEDLPSDIIYSEVDTTTEADDQDIDILYEKVDEEAKSDEPKEELSLDMMYAKVDMAKKREDRAKLALYATVNKERTGVCKYYYDDDDSQEVPADEFEDGHYTKVKEENIEIGLDDHPSIDRQSTLRQTPPHRAESELTTEDNDYELVTESRSFEGNLHSRSAPRPASDSNDYELISENKDCRGNLGKTSGSEQSLDGNEYELITERMQVRGNIRNISGSGKSPKK